MVHRNLGRFQSKVGMKVIVLTSWGGCGLLHKQMSFYFSVYFEGSLPRAFMPRGGDHPIFKCSHVPIKRQSFMCMEVPVLIGSPEVWNTLRWPSLRNGFLYSWVLLRFGTPFGSHPQEWVPILMGSPEVPYTHGFLPQEHPFVQEPPTSTKTNNLVAGG